MSTTVIITSIFAILLTHGSAYWSDDTPHRVNYIEAKVGEYAIFNCHIDFPQDTEIPYILVWSKDEKEIFTWFDGVFNSAKEYIGRITLLDQQNKTPNLGKASINLTSIQDTDGGWYHCRAYFPNRSPDTFTNGSFFHLSIDGNTLLKIPPINQTVLEGEAAQLRCIVKNPETMFVRWYKDGINLGELDNIARRSVIDRDGSLTINPTEMGDLGLFKCKVRNQIGEEQSASAYLNIQYKAKVIYAPKEVYFPYGAPGILDCHFRANPPLTNLRWEKDGFLFDPYNVQGVYYKRNGSLYFAKINDEHAGRYSCIPYNALGSNGPSPMIKVIVQRPPFFRVKPRQIYLTKLGATIEMHCDARDPTSSSQIAPVEWMRKDGRPLPHARVELKEGNMTIEKVQKEDRGIYQCVASNKAARISVDSELMIEGVVPMAPYNVTANSSATAITLYWVPGYIRSYLKYLIWYRPTNSEEWRSTTADYDTEHTITALSPNQEYEFMVLSQDTYGDGLFSKAYRFMTKQIDYEEPQPFNDMHIAQFNQVGPPQNLTLTVTDDREYLLTWDPPEYGLDVLRFYILSWWKEPEHILYGEYETSGHSHIVHNLREDVVYQFQVFSLATTDYRSGSNVVTILVPPINRIRLTTIGSAVVVACLLFAIAAVVYVLRNRRFK